MKPAACRRPRRYGLWLLLGLMPCAYAHHSVTAEYDTSKVIAIDGQVQNFELGSPHSRLVMTVSRADGSSVIWQTELPSVTFLHRAGWTEKSLSVGERIHVTGCPRRSNPTELYAVSVTKTDGSQLPLVPTQ